jgi:preprotein translocase YajC subunit
MLRHPFTRRRVASDRDGAVVGATSRLRWRAGSILRGSHESHRPSFSHKQRPRPETPQRPSFLVSMMPLIFVFVIFYFLLIRPQQKRQKDHAKLVASIKTGDKIVTSSGIHGIVANVKERPFS